MEAKTILLVEDDFLNRRMSRKILAEKGYRILEAKNARETLEIIKKESINLLILDIHLGEEEQDGISLGQQIRDKYGLPFIYLTAYESTDIIDRAIATTPCSYLTKPFKGSDLIASVEIAIRQTAKENRFLPSILVKDDDFNVQLSLQEINFIESEGNYLLFHTEKKVYKSRSTLKQVLEVLPESSFVQVHRAYIINRHKMEKFNSKNVVVGDAVVPVSKSYVTNLPLE